MAQPTRLSFGHNQDYSHVHFNIIIYIIDLAGPQNSYLIKSRILIYVFIHNLCPPHVIPVV